MAFVKETIFLKHVFLFFFQGFHPDGPVAGKKCDAYFLDFKGQKIFSQKDIPMSHVAVKVLSMPTRKPKTSKRLPTVGDVNLCGDRLPSFPCIFSRDLFFSLCWDRMFRKSC